MSEMKPNIEDLRIAREAFAQKRFFEGNFFAASCARAGDLDDNFAIQVALHALAIARDKAEEKSASVAPALSLVREGV